MSLIESVLYRRFHCNKKSTHNIHSYRDGLIVTDRLTRVVMIIFLWMTAVTVVFTIQLLNHLHKNVYYNYYRHSKETPSVRLFVIKLSLLSKLIMIIKITASLKKIGNTNSLYVKAGVDQG